MVEATLHLGRLIRKISPWIVLGMGICALKQRRRRWRAHCRRHEERQEEMLATLREIRDAVKKPECNKPA